MIRSNEQTVATYGTAWLKPNSKKRNSSEHDPV